MSCRQFLLATADVLLCLFVFFPLAVLHWRGTWGLQDVYLLPPSDGAPSNWASLGIGSCLCMLSYIVQPTLATCIRTQKPWQYTLVSRLHMYVHSWGVMCYWRGVWNLMDIYLTEGWINSMLIYLVCHLFTLATCTSRTTVGLPFSVQLDIEPDLLDPDTIFQTQTSTPLRYLCDCALTQFALVTSNIAVWRGIWNILDAFLLPNDHFMSDVISLGLGYAGFLFMFSLEWPLSRLSEILENKSRYAKLVYEDVILVVATWFCLLLWRGGWDLCLEYVIPTPVVGEWASHCIGTAALLILQTFRNVAFNGVDWDGYYEKGEGIYLTKYLRYIFPEEYKVRQRDFEKDSLMANLYDYDAWDEDTDDGIINMGLDLYRNTSPQRTTQSPTRKTSRTTRDEDSGVDTILGNGIEMTTMNNNRGNVASNMTVEPLVSTQIV